MTPTARPRPRTAERLSALAISVLVPAALRLLPLRRTLELCDRTATPWSPPATPHALADRVQRWLDHGRGPWQSSCLTRSVVLYAMLRRHAYRPRLHVGVRGHAASFVAHAWITIGGEVVGELADGPASYRELFVHGG
jgi:hypothetical protein